LTVVSIPHTPHRGLILPIIIIDVVVEKAASKQTSSGPSQHLIPLVVHVCKNGPRSPDGLCLGGLWDRLRFSLGVV
jgi:hypothetical protein